MERFRALMDKADAQVRQLVLDYQAMCTRLNRELYANAGDSEEIDIALHELKKRAGALFPDESSLQVEVD